MQNPCYYGGLSDLSEDGIQRLANEITEHVLAGLPAGADPSAESAALAPVSRDDAEHDESDGDTYDRVVAEMRAGIPYDLADVKALLARLKKSWDQFKRDVGTVEMKCRLPVKRIPPKTS